MRSSYSLLLVLFCVFLFMLRLEACHNDHGGAHEEDGDESENGSDGDDYNDDEYTRRRKRDIGRNSKSTARIRAYFTACLEIRLPNSPYDWRTNVDFSVLDSLWYLNTHQTYCSGAGGGETQECWQEQISNFIKGNSDIVRHVRTCIAHFAEDTGSEPPTNRYHKLRQRRNASPSFRSYTYTSSEVPALSFGSEELPHYSSCLDSTISLQRGRAPLNFRNLSLFIDGNTVDGCNTRRNSRRRQNPTWPYRFVTLTRPDSILRSELEACAKQIYPSDPYWGTWGGWGSCSKTCGSGAITRRRRCHSGVNRKNQNTECLGNSRQSKPCYELQCLEYNWGRWTPYSKCSKSCGGGQQQRTRSCRLNNRFNVNFARCSSLGQGRQQRKDCNPDPCAVLYLWSLWTPFTSCLIEPPGRDGCRRGYFERSRVCMLGASQVSTSKCEGQKANDKRRCFIECRGSTNTRFTSTNFTFGFSSNIG